MLTLYNGFKGRVERIIDQDSRLSIDTTHLPELRMQYDYFSTKAGLASKLNSTTIPEFKSIANVNTLSGIYATVALSAAGKAKYGYNPRRPRFVNGYRKGNTEENNIVQNVIDENINQAIYPNPANDKLYFNVNSSNFKMTLSDITGKILLQQEIINNDGIDISNFSNGCYFININNNSKPFKVIIQH